jgi:uncharacterized coiled-coil protein SlyX
MALDDMSDCKIICSLCEETHKPPHYICGGPLVKRVTKLEEQLKALTLQVQNLQINDSRY